MKSGSATLSMAANPSGNSRFHPLTRVWRMTVLQDSDGRNSSVWLRFSHRRGVCGAQSRLKMSPLVALGKQFGEVLVHRRLAGKRDGDLIRVPGFRELLFGDAGVAFPPHDV